MIKLDAGGPILLVIPIAFLLFMLIISFAEGFMISKFLKRKLGWATGVSFTANIASAIVGYFILSSFKEIPMQLFALYLVTIIVEGIILFLFNKGKDISRVILATLLMNIISYLFLAYLVYKFT